MHAENVGNRWTHGLGGSRDHEMAGKDSRMVSRKHLEHIMVIINDIWEEVKKYRRIKNKRTDTSLQEVSSQVKLANDKELANFPNQKMQKLEPA